MRLGECIQFLIVPSLLILNIAVDKPEMFLKWDHNNYIFIFKFLHSVFWGEKRCFTEPEESLLFQKNSGFFLVFLNRMFGIYNVKRSL